MTTDAAPPQETSRDRGSIQAGLGVLCILHLVQLVFILDGPEPLFFIGVTQILYVIPAIVVLAIQGRTRTIGGVLMGAGLTIFVNALALAVVWLLMAANAG